MVTNRSNVLGIKIIILLFVISLCICTATAHQPRVELGTNSTFSNPISIENPELMQAFYGNLNGNPQYFQIKSDKPFELCVGISVPLSKGLGGTLPSVQITDESGKIIFTLNGTTGPWTPFTGEFKDSYLDGPMVTQNVSAGTYNIKVFNENNQGKYLLLTGNSEVSNIGDYVQDIVNAPILKEQFFGKPVTLLFLEFITAMLAFSTVLIVFTMMLLSRKSPEAMKITSKTAAMVKPVMWIGIFITSILWLYIMFKYSFSILVLVNSIFLIMAILSSVVFSYKIFKMDIGKFNLLIGSVMVLFWCLFIYGAIIII